MKINGLIDEPRWYHIPCKCNHSSVETEYPIFECLHCKFTECWDSVPKEDFTVNDDVIEWDEKTKTQTIIKKQTRLIKEITLVRGKKFGDIIGWKY